jgi:SCP-2 sterol transfer family protein
MTWQGGKRRREVGPMSPFARLKPLAGTQDDPAKGFEMLARALRDYGSPVRLHIRLVTGTEGERIEHWEVQGGSKNAKAQPKQPKDADVVVVMRPGTWTEIAQGQLAPYDALYTGKLRVGGDFEAAKAITRHLSDPASPYVAPC